jgi:hypothetical protein
LEIEKSRLLLRPASEKNGTNQKTKRSDTRHIMAKHPVRRDPPHIKNSNSLVLKKLKLNFNKIWR